MYKAILFDVGDTLIRYEPTTAALYSRRLAEVGISVTADEARQIVKAVELCTAEQIYKETCGLPRMGDDAFQQMIDDTILAFPAVLPQVCKEETRTAFALTWDVMRQKKVLAEGVFPLLETLSKRYRLGIISNYQASLMDFLDEIGLEPYFESIIISGIVGVEKPDTRIFEIALQEMNLAPEECLYVGDHPFDVMGAKNAGLDMALVQSNFDTLPDFIIQKPNFILPALKDLAGIL